ncbi:uncharacterized protein PV06_05619 [Exophiala oligosperma]|uniref:Uncharacterized protein n=1 Tax=Exophiala oligosperma TaxID=215243 RepID=A0A0D2DI10_9EURO|nr:uncharacterized protein PV06_05619 [Exophiala oligosperma]KIW42030.1 hypothetical protein PV06_05619 [Exophiala oligosperma]
MNNPEFRQTLQHITHNLETANQTAQENIYTFTQRYIDPCLSGLKSCVVDCTAPCFPNREDKLRRKRGRSRGRAEYNFDFYEAWDDDEALAETSTAWGNDELDSLLAGHGPRVDQPKRPRAMSYGSRGRRKPNIMQGESDHDPTIIPSSSYLGFLERLPWKLGARKLRYKPSAADLQEHPGATRVHPAEVEPLIEEHDEDSSPWRKGHGRQRSDTNASRSTTNSLSSRGDLIMSDEEDDAVPLDDEFASVMLARRNTNQGLPEDQSSGKARTPSGKRPGASRRSTRTTSSKSIRSPGMQSQRSASERSLAPPVSPTPTRERRELPTMLDLKLQEEQVAREEELEIKQKREAAQRLAVQRGLNAGNAVSAEVDPSVKEDQTIASVGDEVDDDSSSASSEPQAIADGSADQSQRSAMDGKDPT